MKTVKFFIWYVGSKPKSVKDAMQLIKLVIRQKITELWCKRKHNQWLQIYPPLHGAGKYVYNGYQCNVCKRLHIEFEVNSSAGN